LKHSYKKVGANLGAAEIPGAIRPQRPIESAHIVKKWSLWNHFSRYFGCGVCVVAESHDEESRLPAERWIAAEHYVQNDSTRPDVHLQPVPATSET